MLAALAPLVDLVFPPRCPLCGAGLAAQDGLCGACWGALVIPGEPACARCQRPLEDRAGMTEREGGVLVCAPCLARPPRHGGIHAACLYTDVSRRLVLGLKRGRRLPLARLMGRLVAARIPPLAGDWLVVPVPLHATRLWRRGFNQSALIAAVVAQRIGQPFVVDALHRRRRTRSLGGLDRRQRADVLRGAIVARPAGIERLKGAQVLLVDDVMTSGATVDACIAALRKAGARTVRIACFARVLDEAVDSAMAQAGAGGSQTKMPGA